MSRPARTSSRVTRLIALSLDLGCKLQVVVGVARQELVHLLLLFALAALAWSRSIDPASMSRRYL